MHQLHGEEPLPLVLEQLVQAHQVRVLEIGEGAELALEPQERAPVDVLRVLSATHVAALAILRLVHDAHAAFPKAAPELEATGNRESGAQVMPGSSVSAIGTGRLEPARRYVADERRPACDCAARAKRSTIAPADSTASMPSTLLPAWK